MCFQQEERIQKANDTSLMVLSVYQLDLKVGTTHGNGDQPKDPSPGKGRVNTGVEGLRAMVHLTSTLR